VEEWKSNSNLLIKSSLAADIAPTPHELSVDDYEPSWKGFVPLGDPGSAGSGSSVVARAAFPEQGAGDSDHLLDDLTPAPPYPQRVGVPDGIRRLVADCPTSEIRGVARAA
jgi:hypothetical protein